ncbi:MAG TPA: hypothetical protein VF587_18765 [Solirubrobacteraceae bacterium]
MLSARTFTLRPSDFGKVAEVTDESGAPLAALRNGYLTTVDGTHLVGVAVHEPSGFRRDRVTDVALGVGDGQGRPAGGANIVKYGFGPRARKLTLALRGADGVERGRIEPADDRGLELVATYDGAEAARVSIEEVKAGFLRKDRIYTVRLATEPDVLLLGSIIGFDALLHAAQGVSMRD